MGYYNTEHRERLRLIAHVQGRAFSLAAIKETLDHWTRRPLPWPPARRQPRPHGLVRKPKRLSPEDFAERFAGVDITHGDIQRAVQIRLVELDGSRIGDRQRSLCRSRGCRSRHGNPCLGDPRRARGPYDRCLTYRRAVPPGLPAPLLGTVRRTGHAGSRDALLPAAVNQLTELATSVVIAELHEPFAAFAEQYLTRAAESVAKEAGRFISSHSQNLGEGLRAYHP